MKPKETIDTATIVPTSGVSFEKQVIAIRAYVVLSNQGEQSIHYKAVMKFAQLARTQVSGINAFFVGLGFLISNEKGMYTPTNPAIQFCDSPVGNEKYSAIREVLMNSDLFEAVRKFLEVHGRISVEKLIDFLSIEAGTNERTRIRSAIEWLIKPNLIMYENNDVFLE